MAWRSSGTTNDEMVDNMKRFGVINAQSVEEAFRAVDRRFFVPQDRQDVAHSDQPLKDGNVHISAPHIYGSVAEALELQPNSSMSFLNLGSGTGYLSCIVADILGPTSYNCAVEIHEDVVQHCRESIQRWTDHRSSPVNHTGMHHLQPVAQIEVIHGNALEIDSTQGESLVGFDRIYVGAALEKRHLNKLANLLKPNGILVGPVDDELVKVIRIGSSQMNDDSKNNSKTSSSANDFAGNSRPMFPRHGGQQSIQLSSDFSQQVLSGVRFAPLLQNPSMSTIIPSKVWNPSIHHHYPESFRKACREILLCSHAAYVQPPPESITRERLNVACKLPRAIWMEILSYTHRDWFERPRSEEEFLRRRLMEEQAAVQRAQQARTDAENRLQLAERERDIYRLLAMRWQARLQALTSDGGGNTGNGQDVDDEAMIGMDDITDATSAMFADESFVLRLGGLGATIQRLHREADSEDEEDEEDDFEEQQEHHVDDAVMSDDDDMDETPTTHAEFVNDPDSMATSSNEALSLRPQVRTVSITSHDL